MDNPLITLVLRAHYIAAKNNENVSSAAIRQAAKLGKEFPEAVASAVLTLGNVHAPLSRARMILFQSSNSLINEYLIEKVKVPGYGNSFHKDSIDPAWIDVDALLRKDFPEVATRIDEVADLIQAYTNKKIYPNAAAYTAAAAELNNFPYGTEYSILINGRMMAWTEQYSEVR